MKFLNWFKRPPYVYELFQGADGLWRHRTVHANGNIIESSEPYESGRDAAVETITNLSKWTGVPIRG